jgi:dephospho-CoA kinase
MLVIGLTGSIATGKSTVSKLLSEPPFSIPIIDADLLARKVVEPGTPGYEAIVRYFGPSTPDLLVPPGDGMPENGPDGKGRPLNRPALGRRVFGDDPQRKKDRQVLNGIVHPAVRREMMKGILEGYWRGERAVVLDVPLLFEGGLDVLCNAVVVVGVRDPEVQLQRLMKRDPHLTREDAENRVMSQGNIMETVRRCEQRGGVVVWNDAGLDELSVEVTKVVEELQRRNPSWWNWLLWRCPPLAVLVMLWTLGRNKVLAWQWERSKRREEQQAKAKL